MQDPDAVRHAASGIAAFNPALAQKLRHQLRTIRQRDRLFPSGALQVLHELALSVIGEHHFFAINFRRQFNSPDQRELVRRALHQFEAGGLEIDHRVFFAKRADCISSAAMRLHSSLLSRSAGIFLQM